MDQEQRNDSFIASPEGQKSNLSMMVGVGAFIIVLAGLGWYAYSSVPTQEAVPMMRTEASTPAPSTTTDDAAATALSSQGTSDETGAIESDLRATNLDALGDIDKI